MAETDQGYGEDCLVSALQHFRAPEGPAPGPGYSHAVTGRGRWVWYARSATSTSRSPARPPASTAVQVSALAMPDLMIEIEAYAICDD